jgi:general nucleoside transport system permease protein
VAFLGPAEPHRHPAGGAADGADLYRRRDGAVHAAPALGAIQAFQGMLLFFLLALDLLSNYRLRLAKREVA